jgi:hypothetical protein
MFGGVDAGNRDQSGSRSGASFTFRHWCQSVQQFEKFTPHFFNFLRAAMLERLECTVESEQASPRKGLKDNRQRVELLGSPEKPEQRHRKRVGPPLSFRPVKNFAAAANRRQDVLFKVLLPDRTVGVHNERVPTTRTPRDPHDKLQHDRRGETRR